jgi:hypothetical protein
MAQAEAGDQARVTAVIVTNQSVLTAADAMAEVRRCVDAGLLHCVMVDNVSRDGTSDLLREQLGWADVVTALLPTPLAPNDLHRHIQPGAAPCTSGWICGVVMMVRTDLLKRLGGFDPQFFLYYADTDVCKRIEASVYEAWTAPSALVRHIGGASSGNDETHIAGCIAKHFCQSRWHYMIKHHGWLAATLAEGLEACLLGLLTVADMLRGRALVRLRPRSKTPLFCTPLKVVAA